MSNIFRNILCFFEKKRVAVVSSADGTERGRAQNRAAVLRPVRVGVKPRVANRRSVTMRFAWIQPFKNASKRSIPFLMLSMLVA